MKAGSATCLWREILFYVDTFPISAFKIVLDSFNIYIHKIKINPPEINCRFLCRGFAIKFESYKMNTG